MAPTLTESDLTTSLLFSRDNPCSCTIEHDGKVIYIVETRRKPTKGSTRGELTVTTDVYNAAQELLATLEWKDLVTDIITWKSKGMERAKLSAWLKKSKVPFSHSSSFKDDNGNTYKWDIKGPRNQFQLKFNDTVIAYFQRANPYVNNEPGYNYNPAPTPSRLLLTSEADNIRELVVLSFLFMEKDRRSSNSLTEKFADRQAFTGTMV